MGAISGTNWRFARREFLLRAAGGALLLGAGNRALAATEASEIVETAQGKLRGTLEQGIRQFLGIHYGADTGGANRFRPPKPPVSWSGVRDATVYGPSCPQVFAPPPATVAPLATVFSGMMDGAPVTEDCLCLNLWTSGVGDDGRRPVMVWLHGGGFNLNSASAPAFHGANLARNGDVVVISVNHRLNAFGFTDLSEALGDPYRFSGNAGLLDIVAALQWVRDNVSRFGGDPGNVTLFGESGGGQKIATLLGMPAAQGLFHKAVIESAPGVGYLDRETAASIAAMLIEQAGGKDQLRTMPAQALVDAYQATASALQQKMPGRFGFVPVIDGASLPRDPLLPDISPLAAHIPLMIGGNLDEINFFMLGRQELGMTEAELLDALRKRIPRADPVPLVAVCRTANPAATPWELFVLISSDAMTGVQTRGVADRKSRQPAPVYAYRFDWATPALGGHMGAFHGLEIPFVFDNLDRTRAVVGMKPGMDRLAARMSAAWASFAHSGAPSAPGLPDWPAYGVPGRATMIFNDECRVENDPHGKLRAMLAGAA